MKETCFFKQTFSFFENNMKKRFLPFGILLAATGVALNFLSTPDATYTSIENRSKKNKEGTSKEEISSDLMS